MNSDGCVYDLVIPGGGPAGLTAGLYAMRAVLQTVLVERAAPGGPGSHYKGRGELSGVRGNQWS
jgi:thioredoxin reductase